MLTIKIEVTVGTRDGSEIHRSGSLAKVRLFGLLSSLLESVLRKSFSARQTSILQNTGRPNMQWQSQEGAWTQ